METVTLARNAMNTRFELVLHGDNPVSLQAAGEDALAEIERIENQLSLFKPTSEIARVNALAANRPIRVSPEVFNLLNHAKRLSEETKGLFDITIAPLLRCWGMLGCGEGRMPNDAEISATRAVCGMAQVELNSAHCTVQFARAGVLIDLGAIGKGYGVEKAAEILREAGVESALIHGGTSTVGAIGMPPAAKAWKVAIEAPRAESVAASRPSTVNCLENGGALPSNRYEVSLRDESLSVSAVSGKCFVANGRTLGHIIDPRTGRPATGALLSAVVLPSATETDAISTALLVQGTDEHEAISSLRPAMRSMVVGRNESGTIHITARGIEPATSETVR